MLSKAQEKVIASLHTKKGREKHGRCLVEGQKNIEMAGDAVEYTFGPEDVSDYSKLTTTETPQEVSGVAEIPDWSTRDVLTHKTIFILDGLQDPGNVGTILRACLGFGATVILVECADVTSSKVIRSSAGAVFKVPWIRVPRVEVEALVSHLQHTVYRLEAPAHTTMEADISEAVACDDKALIIAGAEGEGITLGMKGTQFTIAHEEALESLNVSHAVIVALYLRYQHKKHRPH